MKAHKDYIRFKLDELTIDCKLAIDKILKEFNNVMMFILIFFMLSSYDIH